MVIRERYSGRLSNGAPAETSLSETAHLPSKL